MNLTSVEHKCLLKVNIHNCLPEKTFTLFFELLCTHKLTNEGDCAYECRCKLRRKDRKAYKGC